MRLKQSIARGTVPAAYLLLLAGPAGAAQVDVSVTGAEPNGTLVYASLCDQGLDRTTCRLGQTRPAQQSVVSFVFEDLPPGAYAVVAFQDLEGTGTLPRSKLGLPLEPYGLSNDAGRLRRPTFQQAAFQVGPEGRAVVVRLRTLPRAVQSPQ